MEKRPRRFSLGEALFEGNRSGGGRTVWAWNHHRERGKNGANKRRKGRANVRSSAPPRKTPRQRR